MTRTGDVPPPKAGADAPKAGVAPGLPKGAGEPAPKAGVLAAKLEVPNAGAEAPKPVAPKAGVLAPTTGVDAAPKAGCKQNRPSQERRFSVLLTSLDYKQERVASWSTALLQDYHRLCQHCKGH